MFKGKENHLDLIQELRTVNALQREEQELQKADKELVKTLTDQRDKSRHKVKCTDTFMYKILLQKLQTISLHLLSLPCLDLSRGGVSGQSGRYRAWTPVWHLVQGADSSPGGAQDPRLYTTGWERPSPTRGRGERKETSGGAQTQRRRWDLQTSAFMCTFLAMSVHTR